MGLSLEFYAGDAARIGADFTAIEFDGLQDGSRARAHADFSLHLSPDDLDTLSEVIAEHTGAAALLLNHRLVRHVGGGACAARGQRVLGGEAGGHVAAGGRPALFLRAGTPIPATPGRRRLVGVAKPLARAPRFSRHAAARAV